MTVCASNLPVPLLGRDGNHQLPPLHIVTSKSKPEIQPSSNTGWNSKDNRHESLSLVVPRPMEQVRQPHRRSDTYALESYPPSSTLPEGIGLPDPRTVNNPLGRVELKGLRGDVDAMEQQVRSVEVVV